jgi:competence protein ComEA
MNEALPRWRTFGTPAVPPPTGSGAQAPASPAGERPTAGLPGFLALVLGGAAGGAAAALLGVALLVPAASSDGGMALTGSAMPASGGVGSDLPAEVDAAWEPAVVADAAAGVIVVDVGGAVLEPGLHELSEGDRVADAIAAAGGYGARVDLAATTGTLNLAEPLVDGSKVVVPELGTDGTDGTVVSGVDDGRIDLNTADQAALESLPGIGPVTAGKILAARSEQPFAAAEELLDRGIVGESVYEDIVELVRVSG